MPVKDLVNERIEKIAKACYQAECVFDRVVKTGREEFSVTWEDAPEWVQERVKDLVKKALSDGVFNGQTLVSVGPRAALFYAIVTAFKE
jgi:hypothetical protein